MTRARCQTKRLLRIRNPWTGHGPKVARVSTHAIRTAPTSAIKAINDPAAIAQAADRFVAHHMNQDAATAANPAAEIARIPACIGRRLTLDRERHGSSSNATRCVFSGDPQAHTTRYTGNPSSLAACLCEASIVTKR